MKKIMTVLSLVCMIFSSNIAVFANDKPASELPIPTVNMNTETTQPKILSLVIGFLGTAVVGYLIDGVLEYETGHSGGEWGEIFIEFAMSYPDAEEIYMVAMERGYKVVKYLSTSGNECIKNQSGSFTCKYSNS